MNGMSFQTLVDLTPGVVVVSPNAQDEGQFSVNGQRASANYWTVDGVSANIGIGGVVGTSGNGNGLAGFLPFFFAPGGDNRLVLVQGQQGVRSHTVTLLPPLRPTPH